MFAVYQVMDDDKILCKVWNADISAYTCAVFFNRPDAELFAEEIAKLKGNEVYKYAVIEIAVLYKY